MAACLVLSAGLVWAEPTSAPLRMGAIYNLTGEQAGLDRLSARGAELAADDVNRGGGINGRRLELVVADGRSNPDEIRRQAVRLLDEGAVALLGLSDTNMVLPAAQEAARAKRVFLTSGATSPLLPGQVPTFLFLACFTDNVQAAAAADFARTRLSADSAALLVDGGTQFTTLIGGYFSTAFHSAGGRIDALVETAHAATDVAGALRKQVGRKPPDVVYLAAAPQEAPVWVRNLRGAGFTQPLIGGDGFDTPVLVSASSGPVYFTTHAFLDEHAGEPAARAFVAAYKTRFAEMPDAFSALGYDAVGLLAEASRRAASDEPAAVLAALAATQDYPGITGTISYGGDRRVPRKPVYIVEVRDHRRALAATLLPNHVPPAESSSPP